MKDIDGPNEVQRAVEYLQESEEPLDAKISALENAANTNTFTLEDVLGQYADAVSVANVIYPSFVSQIRELITAIEAETDTELPTIEEICAPNTPIQTEDDVIRQAIEIYGATNRSSSERQDSIKTLIKDAQRSGISVNSETVISAIKEYKSPDDYDESGDDGMHVETNDVSLASGIVTPDDINAEEEYIYRVELTDEDQVDSIDWYIGGTHAGTGKTLLHKFEFSGIYTVAVEITDVNGDTSHINAEVEVGGASEILVDIIGETELTTGKSTRFAVDIETKNATVGSVQWELDEGPISTEREFTHTFHDDGDHTLSVSVESTEGDVVTETKSITVETATEITVNVTAPDATEVGEKVTINCSINTENSYIAEAKCYIAGEEIDVKEIPAIAVHHTFDKPGDYDVTFTATNDAGDSATATETIACHLPPEVDLVDPPTEVVQGDTETLNASFDAALTSSWGVNNASLTHVGDDTADVTFNSQMSDEATVKVEVQNEHGETDLDEATVTVHEPVLDTVIDAPDSVTAGHVAEFSVTDSVVRHAEIAEIEWTNDDIVIGTGENITYEFSSPGEYPVTATITTERGLTDTGSVTVTVQPDTDVTAVIVTGGGPTTGDEFTLDGSKSISKNTTIDSYSWYIANYETLKGETASLRFEEPGTYDIELKVESIDGDVDRVTEELTVEPYTDVIAEIGGPDSVVIGEQVEFDASESKPENTTITSFQWYLNDKPAGTGETFLQTFSTPGHYTVKVETTTSDGDVDESSLGVVANEPESEVTAQITVDTPVVVNEPVAFKAATTTIYTEITDYQWLLDDDEIDAGTDDTLTREFDEYGPVTATVEVTADDGTTKTVEETVYVLPTLDSPPYEAIDETITEDSVLDRIAGIYRDEKLPETAKNRFVGRVLADAEDESVIVSTKEVVEHVESAEDIDGDVLDTAVIQDARESDGNQNTAGAWAVGEADDQPGDDLEEPSLADPGEDTSEDDGDGSDVDDDVDDWDFESSGDSEDDENEEPGLSDPGEEVDVDDSGTFEEPALSEPDDDYDNAEEDEVDEPEEYDTVAEEDINDDHKVDRIPPETFEFDDSVLSMPNYAQDLVDFEYILEEEDELLPEGVNGAGIVVAENDLYIAMARVEGRDWSIHTQQKKRDIVKTYETNVLTGLDNPIQIVSLPTQFDIRDHIQKVGDVLHENENNESELLMNIGRSIYPNWLEGFMAQNDMKERDFYVIVPLSAEQLHKFKGGSESIIEQLAEAPVIGGAFGRFVEEDASDITKYQCLRELNTRMGRVKSNLRRMDVEVTRVEGRNEAMAVLYHYFNNAEPRSKVFPMGQFTTGEQDATVGGVSIEHLLQDTNTPGDGNMEGEKQ